jgi:subtilisin family serine protease
MTTPTIVGRCWSVVIVLLWASAVLAVVPPAGSLVVDEQGRRVVDAAPRAELPRQVIVKLRPGITVCLACQLARSARLGMVAPGSRLDELLAARGIRSARALLRHVPAGAARGRFPLRAGRGAPVTDTPTFERTWVLSVPGGADLDAVARELAADPAVEYAEPDRARQVTLEPNDPYFASSGSWGQHFDDLWGVKRIGAPAAWDVTRGAGVTVAIVDTGIDVGHPDLAANIWSNPGEVAGNGIDDDGNGFIDDVHGWDFADDDADPHDDFMHGTHVAGTVAAVGDNGIGVVGVAFESRLMAVRGLGTYGAGSTSDLAEAILYAVDNGADVVNASWGGPGSSQTLADVLAVAHAAGVVVVAAAGNFNSDASDFFPAGDPSVVAVAAFTHADRRASFSNFGITLDVGAPGGGDDPPPSKYSSLSILSPLASGLAPLNVPPAALVLQSGGGSYVRLAGTSMAAPHVTGTVALILASDPGLSVEQVRQVLRTTADDLPPAGVDSNSGYGLVNAAAAVVALIPLEAHLTAPAGDLLAPTDVAVTGTARGPGFVSYALDVRPAGAPAGWVPIAGPVAVPVADGVLATMDARGLADGDHVLRLRVTGADGVFEDSMPITIRNVQIETPERLAALRPDGPIEIRGTAAGGGFVRYTVEVRRPSLHGLAWQSDGVTLAVSPGTQVRHGLLATLDVSSVTEGDRFDFRLTVTSASGTREALRRGVVIDPTLRAGWPRQIVPGSDREYLTVADLDGLGTQSVLVGSGNEVIVFEHDGSIRPGWPQSVVVGDPLVGTRGSPLVADVLGDSRPEIIATNGTHLLVWSADGVLQAPFPVAVSVLQSSGNEWITAGDVDGDGKDDVVCSGSLGLDVIRGDGTSVPGWSSTALYNSMSAIGDVLGDARAEVAVWRALNDGAVLRGQGRVSLSGAAGAGLASRVVRGAAFTRVGLADMDGDGRQDMVVLGSTPTAQIGRPRVSATSADGRSVRLRKPKVRGDARKPGLILAFSDLDHDGRAEAWEYLRTSNHGTFADESGWFAPWQWIGDPTPHDAVQHRLFQSVTNHDGPFAIAIGDIDGDGEQELVGGMVGNGCGVLLDTCTGASTPGAPIRRALPVQHADGRLLAGFPKPVPQLFPDDGDGFGIAISWFIDDPFAATPAIGDLDGDGLKEIVWFDPESARIFVWNVAGTAGPLLADWPMYAHDPKHSNTLPIVR